MLCAMQGSFERAVLGRTGLKVGRLGISASYGAPASSVELAFEQGTNYFYWGSKRTATFGEGLRNLASHREQIVLVVQSYSRIARLLGPSLERALGKLRFGLHRCSSNGDVEQEAAA